MAGLTAQEVMERRRVIVGMHNAGLGPTEIGQALGIAKSTVCKHLAKHKSGSRPRRPVSKSLVVGLFNDGATRVEIAKKVGISRAYVTIILTQFGITAVEPVQVPHWVPQNLHADYLDFARDFDEQYAASRVRRLKAEAA